MAADGLRRAAPCPACRSMCHWLSDGSELALGATIRPDESFSVDAIVCEPALGDGFGLPDVEVPDEPLVELAALLGSRRAVVVAAGCGGGRTARRARRAKRRRRHDLPRVDDSRIAARQRLRAGRRRGDRRTAVPLEAVPKTAARVRVGGIGGPLEFARRGRLSGCGGVAVAWLRHGNRRLDRL